MSAEKTSWPLHVIPLNDFREHDAEEGCWCHPTLDDGAEYGHEKIYVHHSMDQRESYEDGKRLPS